MNLWETRLQSGEALDSHLAPHRQLITKGFTMPDGTIEAFIRNRSSSPLIRVCGLTLAKARNTALGIYSLSLDGLGQEAGALLRPLIEEYELLVYLREDPSRVELILQDKLPSPGERAKAIRGELQELRNYLSQSASHFGFSHESLKHLLPLSPEGWRIVQPYSEHALKVNLGALFGMLLRILDEGSNCIVEARIPDDAGLAEAVAAYREEGLALFSNP